MEMTETIFDMQFFIIALVLGVYAASLWLYKKTNISLLNPVLISIVVIIAILSLFNIDYETFKNGSQIIDSMLGLCVVALGYVLYEQVEHIKANLVSMTVSILVGSIVGIVSVVLILKAMGATEVMQVSLAPKSVTTPIAISLSAQLGGITSLTAICVVLVGVFGNIIGPKALDILRIKSKVARGLAMGASAHGIGTARAIEMGAIEGAISGLAIGLMGTATALLVPFVLKLMGVI